MAGAILSDPHQASFQQRLRHIKNMAPTVAVQKIRGMDPKAIRGVETLGAMPGREDVLVDRLWDAGLLDALLYRFTYPDCVTDDVTAGNEMQRDEYCTMVLKGLCNITANPYPGHRGHRLRAGVAKKLAPLILAMADERQQLCGSEGTWALAVPLFANLLGNILKSTPELPDEAKQVLARDQLTMARVSRFCAYLLFANPAQHPCPKIAAGLKLAGLACECYSELVEFGGYGPGSLGKRVVMQLLDAEVRVQRIRLHSLSSASLNGRTGTKQRAFDERKGRYTVVLDGDNKTIAVKPANIEDLDARPVGGSVDIPVHGTVGQHLVEFVALAAKEKRVNLDTWDQVAYAFSRLYVGSGLSLGPYANDLGGEKASAALTGAATHELDRSGGNPGVLTELLAILTNTLGARHEDVGKCEAGTYNSITIRDDSVAGLFQADGLVMLSRVAKQFSRHGPIVEQCAHLMAMMYETASDVKTKKVLLKNGETLINMARSALGSNPRTQSCKAALQRLGNQVDSVNMLDAGKRRVKETRKRQKESDAPIERNAMCTGCSQICTIKGKLLKCGKCKMPYCSAECQVKDWKEGQHKKRCKLKQQELADRVGEHAGTAKGKSMEKFAAQRSRDADILLQVNRAVCVDP